MIYSPWKLLLLWLLLLILIITSDIFTIEITTFILIITSNIFTMETWHQSHLSEDISAVRTLLHWAPPPPLVPGSLMHCLCRSQVIFSPAPAPASSMFAIHFRALHSPGGCAELETHLQPCFKRTKTLRGDCDYILSRSIYFYRYLLLNMVHNSPFTSLLPLHCNTLFPIKNLE